MTRPSIDWLVHHPKLWCTGRCDHPTPHSYYGVRHNGPAGTQYLLYTCDRCKRERVWGHVG